MRNEYKQPTTSVLTWLLCALGSAYFLQLLFNWLGNNSITGLFALKPDSFSSGKVWKLFSYALLHDNIVILLANGLGIYLAGRELLPLLGSKRFCSLVLAAALTGAVAWLALHASRGDDGILVGASAITTGLFIVFACTYPEKEIEFLLFFVLPLRVRPKMAAWVLVAVELACFAFSEVAGGKFNTHIAHSAHLGGILAGWIFYRYFHARNGWDRAESPVFTRPTWLKLWQKDKNKPKYKVNITPPADLKAEVDRILDKINNTGFASLTDEEKRLLDEAKDLLSRH